MTKTAHTQHNATSTKRPRRYVPDLEHMASVCASNYARLSQLLPDLNQGAQRTLQVCSFEPSSQPASNSQHKVTVRIKVNETHRYTSMLHIEQQSAQHAWLSAPRMLIRMYHDAALAEVASFQSQRHFEGHYAYPNPNMHQRDEKTQLNQFLNEWLGHCLRNGIASDDIDL